MNCKNCGSQNHREGDCSKPYNGWKESESSTVRNPSEAADKEHEVSRKSPTESSLTKRKGFPFLRESTRRSIDERIARMTAPKPEMMNQSPQVDARFEIQKPDYNPPKLPKPSKAIKKTINTKQESLF